MAQKSFDDQQQIENVNQEVQEEFHKRVAIQSINIAEQNRHLMDSSKFQFQQVFTSSEGDESKRFAQEKAGFKFTPQNESTSLPVNQQSWRPINYNDPIVTSPGSLDFHKPSWAQQSKHSRNQQTSNKFVEEVGGDTELSDFLTSGQPSIIMIDPKHLSQMQESNKKAPKI